ncbi:P-type DNA transfer ATPase VirB11 [Leisingera sp. JC1]|uniref:P-type DNA transfer ATPase VirB11 n=1 Tax=Leisingera sp. JC1 TaxID=1855282 RepID=UPI000A6023BB|nr:P-type DNA transfer ATPase VirB11 [Leisingera sp. JC1]
MTDPRPIAMAKRVPVALAAYLEPFNSFLDRPDIIEICVNSPGQVFVEAYSGWETHSLLQLTFDFLMSMVRAIGSYARQEINETNPLLSGSLPGGERIQIVVPPAVPAGTVSITIRKPARRSFTLEELAGLGMFDDVTADADTPDGDSRELLQLHKDRAWLPFLKKAVSAKKNILISGATGSGKTTFSKALIPLIPEHERLITIEDTVELELPQPNAVRLIYSKGGQGEANVSARDLLESALRMRPDRIFLQELRDAAAFYYLRNVNTGHSGSITTIHADSAQLAFEQLALLVKESEAGRDLKRGEIKDMLFQMVDVVVQIRKTPQGRRIAEIFFDPSLKQAKGGTE